MTDLALRSGVRQASFTPILYGAAIFLSAALVFMVQPMVARMILPDLGGSPAVWNTSMVFFQTALLVGYAYAHVLQRLRSVKAQAAAHIAALALATLFLPLQITERFGAPPSEGASLWLLGVLAVSIGAPFALLSATAPLMQAWYARRERSGGGDPYVLYAASNAGSLIGLMAYPLLLEPGLALQAQGRFWTAGFAAFFLLAIVLGVQAWTAPERRRESRIAARAGDPVRWSDRLAWVGLAALPSSLLLGVTTHLSTDVAAAPFLWAAPLALYLVTFIVAFQAKPAISSDRALFWHGGLAAVCAAQFMLNMGHWALMLALNLSAFFFAALVCHQMLKARRPSPERLTEFFLLVSVGGALGGALTAFVAPQVFSGVWEYPLAIVLTALIRPRRGGAFSRLALVSLGVGAISLLAAVGLRLWDGPVLALQACALGMVASAFLLRDRPWAFTLLLAGLAAQAGVPAAGSQRVSAERGFFGVLEVSREADDQVGPVHALYHGTTLHGAQALAPAARCTPMTYYAPATAIGQTFAFMHGQRPSARMGVVGLGAGSVASYVRPSDSLRFFEIDPLVVRIASDPSRFTFLSECARGPVSIELGDARLTVGRQAPGGFDLLVVDAFSSDSVPTHLLTQEAVELYLDRLAPDGLLVMHLSNRHLKLAPIAAAAARRAGADALVQNYAGPPGGSLRAASSEVLVASRSLETLAALSEDRRWRRAGAEEVRPWTDDYVNLVGALIQGAR